MTEHVNSEHPWYILCKDASVIADGGHAGQLEKTTNT